ncbi:MAG: hypothetical protein M1829_004274 [Trizodia sp. TS-e1964]|nr:MAG: hypothetical protein M1829_004274 [Trizodia sp. TS-e1964]
MRRTHNVSSTAQALRQVFIGTPPIRIINNSGLQKASIQPRISPILDITHPHTRSLFQASIHNRQPRYEGPPRDEDIRVNEACLVQADGSLSPVTPLRQLLGSYDRLSHYLVCVQPATRDKPAICKIMQREEPKSQQGKRSKAAVSTKKTVIKHLEVNWAIDPNDLQRRLDNLEAFLSKGWRVEVLLAPKKRGRRASPEEASNVMEKFQAKAKELGAKEWKAMEGQLMKRATLYLEGIRRKDNAVSEDVDGL